jgi:small subunit ribosomal protein S6
VIRPYETMIVFDGTLSDDVIQKEQKQIEDFLKQNAKFEKTDVWGKRALAYTVKKKKTGYYCLYLFSGEGSIVASIDKHLKLNEQVLRYLTVVRNVKNDVARAAVATRRERPVQDIDTSESDKSEE